MTTGENIQELLSRTCDVNNGTKVTNCIQHMNRSLFERPSDCKLCATDVANRLRTACDVNEWLNTWKDDAERILRYLGQPADVPVGGLRVDRTADAARAD